MERSSTSVEEAYWQFPADEPVGEERFAGVGEAVEGDGDARAAICIVEGTIVVVAIANVGVAVGGTPVHSPRDLWDRNGGAVSGMGRVDSRNIEASRLAPSADQEGEDRVDTCRVDCSPSAGGLCIGVGHTVPVEVRKATHKRTKER